MDEIIGKVGLKGPITSRTFVKMFTKCCNFRVKVSLKVQFAREGQLKRTKIELLDWGVKNCRIKASNVKQIYVNVSLKKLLSI